MQLDQIVFRLGERDITILHILIAGAGVALALLLLTVLFAWRAQRGRREEAKRWLQLAQEGFAQGSETADIRAADKLLQTL